MKDESEEFNEPHLPARYTEHVRKKRRRRLLKRISILGSTAAVILLLYLALSGTLIGTPHPSPSSPPVTPPVPASPAVSPAPTTVPDPAPVPTTVPPAPATTAGRVTAAETPEPILTARAAAFITATGTPQPKITGQQATTIVLASFPDLPAGQMTVRSITSQDFGPVWECLLLVDTTRVADALVDAETGTLLALNRTIFPGGRPENPVLTRDEARTIADRTISNRNNVILAINMSSSRYNPLVTPGGSRAGSYRFLYTRMVQDYPCDADGFIVAVDAVSGVITEYVQHWETPDNAFMLAEDPLVPRFDATYAVASRAKSIYPSSVAGLRIISADICWKDRHDPATIPRPATIPLAWKVVFDDEAIRAKADPSPAVGWVDTQTGEIMEFNYRH